MRSLIVSGGIILKSKFYYILTKIVDLVLLNLIFIVTCIPIVTIGTSLSALYDMVLKMSDDTESYIFRGYFAAWKRCFKKGTVIWIIALMLLFLFRMNFNILPLMPFGLFRRVLYGAQILAILVIYEILQYLFPLITVWEKRYFGAVKCAFYFSFKYLPWTFGCLCITALPIILIFFVPGLSGAAIVFMILIGFSGISYVEAFFFRNILKAL